MFVDISFSGCKKKKHTQAAIWLDVFLACFYCIEWGMWSNTTIHYLYIINMHWCPIRYEVHTCDFRFKFRSEVYLIILQNKKSENLPRNNRHFPLSVFVCTEHESLVCFWVLVTSFIREYNIWNMHRHPYKIQRYHLFEKKNNTLDSDICQEYIISNHSIRYIKKSLV